MAYLTTGSTTPFLVLPAVGGGFSPSSTASYIDTAGNMWVYRTTDSSTAIAGTSQYFTDGFRRGIRKYDIMAIIDGTRASWAWVSALSTVSTGGATVTLFSST